MGWDFYIGVVNITKAQLGQREPWRPLDWQHGIFVKKIPSTLSKLSKVWVLLRGVTLGIIWIDMNDFQ
jgi:hypothetical protein